MGEIAEMVIDGQMCQSCGHCFDDVPGYPRYCGDCEKDRKRAAMGSTDKAWCPECGKKVKRAGLFDHLRDVHASPDVSYVLRKL